MDWGEKGALTLVGIVLPLEGDDVRPEGGLGAVSRLGGEDSCKMVGEPARTIGWERIGTDCFRAAALAVTWLNIPQGPTGPPFTPAPT